MRASKAVLMKGFAMAVVALVLMAGCVWGAREIQGAFVNTMS